MNLRNIYIYGLTIAAFAGLSLTSCTDDSTPADPNAIHFSAKLQEGAAETPRRVSVQAGGKTYSYTLSTDGTMTAQGEALTWTGTDFDIKAWTPIGDKPVNLKDQTTAEKMAACDLLACDTKATSHYVFLAFGHRMTRVMWDFASIDASYTAEQVSAAKVWFIGYGSTRFDGGNVTPEGNADQLISACESTTGSRQGEAILAPADMWGRQFIKVEIGGDEYFYVPEKTNATDLATNAGDLTAGRTQKYHISITRKTLAVRMESSDAEWGHHFTLGEGDIADAKLTATISADVAGQAGYTVSGVDGRFITDRTTGFTISYTEEGLGGLTWSGNCKVTRSETVVSGKQTKHTYTFSDIKSDISVAYLSGVEAGDYLYDNGAWGKEETREGCRTVGRVFRAGLNDKDDSQYSLGKVRGYVAPMAWNSGELKWFVNQSDARYLQALAAIPVSTDAGERMSYYGGYRLTGLIQTALTPFRTDWQTEIPFWSAFKDITLTAPAMSSGWYIPTCAQLKDIFASGLFAHTGTYGSSQVYAGTNNSGVFGIEEGDKTTLWAIRCADNQTETYGWAIDAAKLLPVLTF